MFHHDVYQNYPAYLLFSGVWWGWLWFCHCDCCRPYHVLTESEVKIYRWFPSDETAVVYDKDCELCLRWWTLRLFIITAGKWTYVINMSHYERYCGSARSEGVWVSHLFTLPFTTKGCASSGMPSFFFSVCVCVCELSLRALASVIFSCCAGVAVWEPTGTLPPPPAHAYTHHTHSSYAQAMFRLGINIRLGWLITKRYPFTPDIFVSRMSLQWPSMITFP